MSLRRKARKQERQNGDSGCFFDEVSFHVRHCIKRIKTAKIKHPYPSSNGITHTKKPVRKGGSRTGQKERKTKNTVNSTPVRTHTAMEPSRTTN